MIFHFSAVVFLLCLWAQGLESAMMKPGATMINSLGEYEATREADTKFSEQLVGKLAEIATVMREGNHDNVEIASKNGLEMMRMIRTQETRLFELESKLTRIYEACQNSPREEQQDRDLTSIKKRLDLLEQRLNQTLIENSELKETLTRLQEQSRVEILSSSKQDLNGNETETEILLQRSPRNYLSSSPDVVAFDAFRNKPFHTAQSYITFDGTNVNTGNAFDPETGIFRAPRSGIYAFTFHALTQDGRATYVKLVHNGKNVGGTYRRHEGEGDENHDASASAPILRRAEGMLAQSVILDLSKGDQVQVFAYHGNLRDGGWHYTHFNGFLIQ